MTPEDVSNFNNTGEIPIKFNNDNESNEEKVAAFLHLIDSLPGGLDGMSTQESEKMATRFLRARKMDVDRAVQLYKAHKRMRYTENIDRIDPAEEGVHRELLSEKFTVLSSRDSAGAAIALFKAERHCPLQSTRRDTLKGVLFQLDAATMDETTQRNGLVFIYDMASSKYSNFDYDFCIKLLHMLKGTYPARLRKVYILAAPLWFRAPFQVLRRFLKEKMRERVNLVDKKDLANYLGGKDAVPVILGGTLIIDHHTWLQQCFRLLQVEDRIGPRYFEPPVITSRQQQFLSSTSSAFGGFNSLRHPRRASSFQSHQQNHFSIVSSGGVYNRHRSPERRFPGRSSSTASSRQQFAHFVTAGNNDINQTNNNNTATSNSKLETLRYPHDQYQSLDRPSRNNSNRFGMIDRDFDSSTSEENSIQFVASSANQRNNHEGGPSVFLPDSAGLTISQFEKHVANLAQEGIFKEYEANFKTRDGGSCEVFKNPENKSKNRYIDVPCLDNSRVTLPNGRYIHANWVDTYQRKNAFICTQGPLPNTSEDFWWTVWTYKVPIIVMTTKTIENRRVKCFQYWPEHEEEKEHVGPFTVKNTKVQETGIYRKTTLTLKNKLVKSAQPITVVHFYFTSWPDFGIPENPGGFLTFLADVNTEVANLPDKSQSTNSPVIVHCSAGIGRTGTFIAMDVSIRRLEHQGLVDMKRTVELLRAQRAGSIQMPHQYLFCHLALLQHARSIGLLT